MIFFQNSRKYRLGSFRKTPTKGTPPVDPDRKCGQFSLTLQPKTTLVESNVLLFIEEYLIYRFPDNRLPIFLDMYTKMRRTRINLCTSGKNGNLTHDHDINAQIMEYFPVSYTVKNFMCMY